MQRMIASNTLQTSALLSNTAVSKVDFGETELLESFTLLGAGLQAERVSSFLEVIL